jgi:hypothetical protein
VQRDTPTVTAPAQEAIATVTAANPTTAAVTPAAVVMDTAPVAIEPTAAERAATERLIAEQAEQERLAREEARRVAEARLKREMAQLMQATQALNTNPARALSLAQAGEQEFRSSLFSEERQHVLLLAIIKLGRVDEAQQLSVPYVRAHPDSPFARRVRNALDAAKYVLVLAGAGGLLVAGRSQLKENRQRLHLGSAADGLRRAAVRARTHPQDHRRVSGSE